MFVLCTLVWGRGQTTAMHRSILPASSPPSFLPRSLQSGNREAAQRREREGRGTGRENERKKERGKERKLEGGCRHAACDRRCDRIGAGKVEPWRGLDDAPIAAQAEEGGGSAHAGVRLDSHALVAWVYRPRAIVSAVGFVEGNADSSDHATPRKSAGISVAGDGTAEAQKKWK